MPSVQQQEHGRGPEFIPADWGKEADKGLEKKVTFKEPPKKEPWSVELGQKTLEMLTAKIKEAQDENSPDVDKWQKQLGKDIERQLKNCVNEYAKAKSLIEVANHIKNLETTGAVYLGEDMDEVYEKLKIKDEIEGIKNEAEAKQKLERMLASKRELKAVSEKLMAEADTQITAKKAKIGGERNKQVAIEALAGQPIAKKAVAELPTNEKMNYQSLGWFGKLKFKLGFKPKTVENAEEELLAKGERYALKLEEKAEVREAKKESGEASKRLKEAYLKTEFEEKVNKEMDVVMRAEAKTQEKSKKAAVRAEWNLAKQNVGKGFDQDAYLEATKGKSRTQKIIDRQKNYPEMRGKAFEIPAQAADYLKEAGLPEALIDSATSRMKELRQDAKAHSMAEQAINEVSQNFLTGIVQKFKENPRLFSKKPPTSYEERKMEELIDKVEKETREKAA